MNNNKRIFRIKFIHTVIFFYMTACLIFMLYAAIFRVFNPVLLIAIISIVVEGLVLLLNHGRCPFTNLAEKYGAESGSVTDIFLPDIIAKNTFRFSTALFAFELIVLAVRYFANI